jgi:hypothetical protein
MLNRLCKFACVYLALGLAALATVMTFSEHAPPDGLVSLSGILVWPWLLYQHFVAQPVIFL